MTLIELSKQIYADNVAKGYDGQDKYLSRLMILTEISEAVNAIRKDNISSLLDYKMCKYDDVDLVIAYDKLIHHSLIDELADIMIRSLDYMERFSVDLDIIKLDMTIKGAYDRCIDVYKNHDVPIEDISIEELSIRILECISEPAASDDNWFTSSMLAVSIIIAVRYDISPDDLEYVIHEKIEYNKTSLKKSF